MQIKKLKNAEQTLGVRLVRPGEVQLWMPENFTCLGISPGAVFCFAEGFQQTVFALCFSREKGLRVYPVAYDVTDFLRLILTVGSADRVAAAAAGRGVQPVSALSSQRAGLLRRLNLSPVADPDGYLRTIRQILDLSSLTCEGGFRLTSAV